MKKIKNGRKGITLISLVITIVILLILAGISIYMLTQTNLFEKAKQAKEITEIAEFDEKIKIYQMEAQVENKTLKEIMEDNGYLNIDDINELEKNGILTKNNKFILISNFNGLKELSKNVNRGINYEGKAVYLVNDIDCKSTFNEETGELIEGENFEPRGNSNSKIEDENKEGSVKYEFNGTFDGCNYTIKNLYIEKNETTDFCTALFGYVGENGTIKNLTIDNSYIHGYFEIGAFVGRNRGKIINCTNNSTVIGDSYLTGGIAGRNTYIISNCINNGKINGGKQTGGIVGNCDYGSVVVENCRNYGSVYANNQCIGGIIGGFFCSEEYENTLVSNCVNEGKICFYGEEENIENGKEIGGICGIAKYTNIENCLNRGEIKGYDNIGGIAGHTMSTTINNCSNHAKIEAIYARVGGITGASGSGTIKQTINYGEIVLDKGGYYGIGGISGGATGRIELSCNYGNVYDEGSTGGQAGGIVGNFSGEILNCYNTGSVKGLWVAGIADWTRNISIKNCYNVGKLESSISISSIGGIVGSIYDASDSINITNNYYLDSCGAIYGKRIRNEETGSDEGAEAKSSNEIKEISSILGNEFSNDDEKINDGYPILNWQIKK